MEFAKEKGPGCIDEMSDATVPVCDPRDGALIYS
jgi:hypothetical protein